MAKYAPDATTAALLDVLERETKGERRVVLEEGSRGPLSLTITLWSGERRIVRVETEIRSGRAVGWRVT